MSKQLLVFCRHLEDIDLMSTVSVPETSVKPLLVFKYHLIEHEPGLKAYADGHEAILNKNEPNARETESGRTM